jgi:hypothetical protein
MDPRTAPVPHARNGEEFARQQQAIPSGGMSGGYYARHRGSLENVMPHTAAPRVSISEHSNFSNALNGPPRFPSITSPSTARREFMQPFNQLYDTLSQAHRFEGMLAGYAHSEAQLRATTAQANELLENLQRSADNLKEMVRYEVSRARSADKKEIDELKETVRRLEESLARRKSDDGGSHADGGGESRKRTKRAKDTEAEGGKDGEQELNGVDGKGAGGTKEPAES